MRAGYSVRVPCSRGRELARRPWKRRVFAAIWRSRIVGSESRRGRDERNSGAGRHRGRRGECPGRTEAEMRDQGRVRDGRSARMTLGEDRDMAQGAKRTKRNAGCSCVAGR